MISFKLFVEAIHHAIVSASDSLMDKNEGLLDKYFEKPVDGEGKNKGALVPKIVQLEYPALDDTGAVTTTTVQVPLITLVPVTASKIEKATVTAEFALEVINDELQISFPNKKISENATVGIDYRGICKCFETTDYLIEKELFLRIKSLQGVNLLFFIISHLLYFLLLDLTNWYVFLVYLSILANKWKDYCIY